MAQLPDTKRLQQLAWKFLQGTISNAEQQELDDWFLSQDGLREDQKSVEFTEDEHRHLIYARIQGEIQKSPQRKIRTLWPRIAAAASILIAVSAGGYFVIHKHQQPTEIAKLKPGTFKNDALPGNKAFLTLGNGQQLAIASIPTGHINHTTAQKTATGALVYTPSNTAPEEFNTLTIPRGGGKHEIQLADGTLAVLDAESSIRYPVAFNGKDRKVNITGQVYFEVAHKTAQPFYVTVGNQTIQDIGTHFNVYAFDGEIRTTLIEGRIKVNNILLKPGQQALQTGSDNITINTGVDEEGVLAWKNDLFKFSSNTSLQTVMNQLSRWYDLDVQYEGTGKEHHFGGYVPRNSKLSDVCKILEYSGVRFSLDGKKIIVYQ